MPSVPSLQSSNNSMPISSMLGSDIGRPTHHSTQTNATSNPFSNIGSTIISPKWQSTPTAATSSPQIHERARSIIPKSQSSERVKVSRTQISVHSRASSGGALRRSLSSATNGIRENTLKRLPTGPFFSPKLDSGPQKEWRILHDKYSSTGRPVDRPTSHPGGYSISDGDLDDRLNARPATLDSDGLLRTTAISKGPGGTIALEGAKKQQAVRPVNVPTDYLNHRAQRPQDGPPMSSAPNVSQTQGVMINSSYPFFNRKSNTPESQRPRKQPKIEPSTNRVLEREPQQPQPPYTEEYLRRLREERLVQQSSAHTPSNQQSRPVQQGGDLQGQIHSRNQHLAVPSLDRPGPPHNLDQSISSEEENLQTQRGSLAHLFADRRGRVSPLPQAVQRAQHRLTGPASDPGIKSEFARLFIGIGNRVGNAERTGSGASSPFPASPTPNPDTELRPPFSGRSGLARLTKASTDSRGGKNRRKTKSEEAKPQDFEVESRDILEVLSSRGIKRGRHSHHHHHPHNHHHHHHHHDERSMTPVTNLADLKRVNTPSQSSPNLPAGSHHHHHRHHHHHHHHRHNPKVPVATAVAAPVPESLALLPFPTTRVDSKQVLESVQHLPRNHLGSRLYQPSEIHDPALAQAAQLISIDMPEQTLRFEGKENCTVTIRIPRFYLKNSEREKICIRREVWGVDIYTDDSDPLAVAIHSGWIQGHWGTDLDASMLEMNNIKRLSTGERKLKTVLKEIVYTAVPPEPLTPIPGKDLHLTLLILPPLQKYASLIRHGIKSRTWNHMYGGMSFMIEKIAWLDGGAGNGEERGGEARRRRMKILQGMGS